MLKWILHLHRHRLATVRPQIEISRRWVETADERCPLACVWFALPQSNEEDDESGLAWPAFSHLFWKAGYLHCVNTLFAYSEQLLRTV